MRLGLIPSAEFRHEHHIDAVDGTRRNAQLAARAKLGQHGMPAFATSHDCVNRARLDAQSAADAMLRVNAGDVTLNGSAAAGVNWFFWKIQQGSQRDDCTLAAGGAPV
jgi:hypothetical protein